jgi:hypothetical protein
MLVVVLKKETEILPLLLYLQALILEHANKTRNLGPEK